MGRNATYARLDVQVPAELKAALEAQAEAEKKTLSKYIKALLASALKRE